MGAHDLFVAHKALIERVARRICLRHHIYGDEAEEFTQDLWIHLIKDDYAIIRKHRGESTLDTYLTTVVANFARDFREKKWGKWRLSVAARERGPVAEQLDTLVSRDGFTLDEACEVLATRGVTATRAELEAIAAVLPARRRPREVQPDDARPDPVSTVEADQGAVNADERRAAARVLMALKDVLAALSPRDRLIIKLRFYDGLSQVSIARKLGVDEKLFFRLGNKLEAGLRQALEARGLSKDQIVDVLECRGLASLEDVDE